MPDGANDKITTQETDAEEVRAVGDVADPRTMETDPNGAHTAVGVKHPENRRPRPHVTLPDEQPYLDDYDTDVTPDDPMPPDEDEGRSFPGLADTGETDGLFDADTIDTEGRLHSPRGKQAEEDLIGGHDPGLEGALDNQTDQPKQFHQPEQQKRF